MQKTYLPEFIAVACQQGISPSKIRKTIDASGMKDLFDRENTVWVDAQSQQVWYQFYARPWRFWVKHRTKGLVITFGQFLCRFTFIQNRRYPTVLNLIYRGNNI